MTSVGSRLHLRLFLEGVEVPVVSASITSQKNAAAVCSIQLPANDYLLDLKPRTLVHLFCFDGVMGAPANDQVWVGGAGIDVKQRILKDPDQGPLTPATFTPPSSPEMAMIDLENDNYKLIFGGEVIGIQYQKSPQSRGMVLQCVDWSSYWDVAYQYQVSGMSLGGGGIKAAFTGASTTVFNEFFDKSGDIVFKLLNTPPRSYPNLKGTLLGGIMHIIEAIGGCYYGKNAVRGTNDFFSLAEMRLHLTQMIGANRRSNADETRLLKANGFDTLFTKTLGGLGQLVTVRQVLLALQKYIFHEIVPITAPRYTPPEADPNAPQRDVVGLGQDPATAPLSRAASSLKQAALDLLGRVEGDGDLLTKKGKSAQRGGLQRELLKLSTVAVEASRKARKVALSTGDASMLLVSGAFETTSRRFGDVLNVCLRPVTITYELPLSGTSDAKRVSTILDSISTSMQQVLEAKHSRPSKVSAAQSDPPARLLTQIYRPDVWMVAPPRCNVLFPEQYSSFSFGRNFLSEVSRMLLRTHEAFYGSDILFDGFYMAPSRLTGARKGKKIGKGRLNVEPPDLTDAPAWVVKDMMDHELYTGITPTFERMSDLNLHAIRGGSVVINGAKVGYAQLACNHIFHQYRFRSRELMASGKFNPYAVLGFPMVVIDKYIADDVLQGTYDSGVASKLASSFLGVPANEQSNIVEVKASQIAELTADLVAERPNTHYLGTPDMIAHNLSAGSGGTTQFQMGYARVTNERTEFLGDNTARSQKAKRKKNVKVPTIVAALEPPRAGTKGILGGKIIDEPKDVTSQYQRNLPKKPRPGANRSRFGSATMLPLFVADQGFSGRKKRGTRVPVGVSLPATDYGPEVVALAGSGGSSIAADGDVLVTFRAYRIVEELGAYATEEVTLPPEELTFPPWYGEHYRTKNVGAMYSDYFGVGAITDPTGVLAPNASQTYADDLSRALRLQFAASFGESATPPAGLASVPEISGGGVLGPAGEDTPEVEMVGEVSSGSTISDAVAEIVKIYSATRTQHYDTPAFVYNYTWRPIASMVDLFGTADLNITEQGLVTSGREGFHSRAFGDYDDLRQLAVGGGGVMPQKILGLEAAPSEVSADRPDPSKEIAKRLDTRKEKRLAVLRYLTALAASRGVLLG
jgi:hypothetical protein